MKRADSIASNSLIKLIANTKNKVLLFTLSAFLLTFTSCKKEEASDSSVVGSKQTCTLNKISYWSGLMPMDVATDSLGNIIKYGIYDLVKSGDSVLFRLNGQITSWYILYDKSGRPIQYKSAEGYSYELTYNNTNEQPQKIVFKSPSTPNDLTMMLTYTDNNVSQIRWTNNGQETILFVTYNLNKLNLLAKSLKLLVPGWKLDMQVPYSFATLFSKNLVKTIGVVNMSEMVKYDYKFDSNGNITQEKLLFGPNDTLVTNYGYLCK